MKRNRLVAAAIVIAILVVLLVIVPMLVNADSFRSTIESRLRTSLGRPVTIGKLSFSLLAGGIRADQLAIADDPAFGREPFLQAQSLQVGVKLVPLIFSRSLEITDVTLEKPELVLVRSAAGKWNFSSLGSGGRETPRPDARGGSFSVERLKISDGHVSIVRPGGKPSVYDGVKLEAQNVGYGTAMPFTLKAQTPGGGKLAVEGAAGPLDRSDSAQTPLDAKVTIEHMDLATTGFLDPASGMAGVMDYTGTLKSDGRTARSQGTAKIDKLRLVRSGQPARQPVSFQYVSDYDLKRETGTLSQGEIRTGNSTTRVAGNFDTHGESTLVHMKVSGQKLPVRDVEGLLPALGVVLPAGASLQGGTVDANLSLDGLVDRLVTTGTVQVANTRLAGYDLASKLAVLSALSGLKSSSDTEIQVMSSQLRIAPEGLRADNLNIVMPAIGSLAGNGIIGPNNALNFRMVARLASQGGLLGQMMPNIPVLGGRTGKGTIPFLIQGTTSNPVFVPDVAGAAGSMGTSLAPAQGQQSTNPLGDVLGGIFGQKKKK